MLRSHHCTSWVHFEAESKREISMMNLDVHKMPGTSSKNIIPNGGLMVKNPMVQSVKKSPNEQIQVANMHISRHLGILKLTY